MRHCSNELFIYLRKRQKRWEKVNLRPTKSCVISCFCFIVLYLWFEVSLERLYLNGIRRTNNFLSHHAIDHIQIEIQTSFVCASPTSSRSYYSCRSCVLAKHFPYRNMYAQTQNDIPDEIQTSVLLCRCECGSH